MAEETAVEVALKVLQPIRDLAKNWDIDIASCLDEYLEEIGGDLLSEEISSADIESLQLNFAQAALVLQNSSNVYSRKVEYLHSLVYKALDDFVSHSIAKKSRSRKSNGPVEDFLDFDEHQEFLDLHDILPTAEDDNNNKTQLTRMETPVNRRASFRSPRLSLSVTGTSTIMQDKSAIHLAASMLEQGIQGGPKTCRLMEGFCDNESEYLNLPGSQLIGINPPPPNVMDEDDVAEPNDEFPQADDDNHVMDNDDDGGPGFAMNDWEGEANQNSQPRRVTFAPEPKKRVDYWKRLDPHELDKVKPRPLRVGKTIRLPPGIDAPPSVARPGVLLRAEPEAANQDYSSFAATAYRSMRKRQLDDEIDFDEVSVPLQGLAFGKEFAYIAKANLKRKAAERREHRKLAQRQNEYLPQPEYDDGDDNDFPDVGNDDWDDGMGNTGMASVDQVYQNEENGDDNMVGDGDENLPSFEELCRAHLQAFRKGAEKYASETQLIKRVDQWQDKLVPVLQDEEKRPEFDILKYSQRVINTMETKVRKSKTKGVDFQHVTRHRSQYDVCRLFLASLSLANSGNVQPKQTNASGNQLELELLNGEIDQPMETYLAPSAVEMAT